MTNRQQAPIFFDDTRITGSYEVSAASEGGSQTFSFNAQGFYAGEKVSVVLKNKNDADIQYALGELTVDTAAVSWARYRPQPMRPTESTCWFSPAPITTRRPQVRP